MKVFMGGTCNESDWRNRIIPMLEVGFFNPVVDDWTPDCMAEELRQREECDVCLYVITPKMTGVYSVAEVIDDSNKRPARTVFVRLRDDGDEKFTDGQWKSLGAVAQMVERNGGTAFDSLKSAALHINAVTPNELLCLPENEMEQGYYSVIATPREALYEAACAMDNQDVPLEDWPMKLIAALTRAGFAVVPAELPHDVLGRAAIAGVAETGNPKHAWDFLIAATRAA